MDLASARQQIVSSLEAMRVLYAKPVFDEWAILSSGAKHGGILAYSGPRVEQFKENFAADIAPLCALLGQRKLGVGDFEFTPDGDGPRYDGLLKIGPTSFVVCNNLAKSMAAIRADARWLKAQAAFFELSEKFRADPLAE